MVSSFAFSNPSAFFFAGLIFLMSLLVWLGRLVKKEFSCASQPGQKLQVIGQAIIIGVTPVLLAVLLVAIDAFRAGF